MGAAEVTVYVPTFNRPAYLLGLLDSLRHQTFQDFDLVVIDNASSEDYTEPLRLVEKMGGTFERHEENVGVIGNFRRAFERVHSSPWFLILHDDDLLHPEFLARLVAAAVSTPELRFVACEMTPFTSEPPTINASVDPPVTIYRGSGELGLGLLTYLDLPFPSVLYRRDQALVASFDDDRYSIVADRPLLLELASNGPVGVVRERLLFYRQHPEQSSRVGPLAQEHLLALFGAYVEAAAGLPRLQRLRVQVALARGAIPSWRRLDSAMKTPLHSYLRIARRLGAFSYPLLAVYGYDLIRSRINRLRATDDS
jgi:glycosyltransferase involved in cell wall biosynthesis